MATFVPKKNRTEHFVQKASDSQDNANAQVANDLVIVARIGAAYGIKGWVKIHPFSHSPDALQNASRWWIAPYIPEQNHANALWQQVKPKGFKPHADVWVGTCQGWLDRTHAEQFKGWQIAVSRTEFPQTDEDEFYWVDLLGMSVINRQGEDLGAVADLLSTGPQTVLVIRHETTGIERLIPFVDAYIDAVDQPERRIRVDWLPEYD